MRKGEYPITRFWYGKGAKYGSIEALIRENPQYFIWTVEKFQDVTKEQAELFHNIYGMELPQEVVCFSPIKELEIPLNGTTYTVRYPFEPKDFPRSILGELYEKVCEEYLLQKRDP